MSAARNPADRARKARLSNARPDVRVQRGVTLVELMVATVLGLLVVLLVGSVFLSTNRSSVTQDAAAQLDDAGRFALETVSRALRQAGYANWGGPTQSPPRIRSATLGGDPVVQGTDGTAANTNFSDSFTVRFFGSGPTVGATDRTITDCVGDPVPEAATTADQRTNVYTVVRNGDTLELMCDPGTGPVRLLSGIASMQVLYGLDRQGTDRVADRWARASDITSWDEVVAVRVSFLMQGAAAARGSQPDSTVYRLFDTGYVNNADGGTVIDAATQDAAFRNRLHRVYTTTVFLRNRTLDTI